MSDGDDRLREQGASNAVPMLQWRRRSLCLIGAVALNVAGCSSNDTTSVDVPIGEGSESGESAAEKDEPLYLLSARVTLPEGSRMSYFLTVPSIEEGATYTLDAARESGIDGWVFGKQGQPTFWQAGQGDATITRWTVTPSGSFERGPAMDLSMLGLTQVGAAGWGVFPAEDRAYFLQWRHPHEIIVWNPQAMELIGTIPLDVDRQGPFEARGSSIVRQGDRLLAVVYWQGADDFTALGNNTRIFEIDLETDQVSTVSDDDRCNVLFASGEQSNGTQFFSAESWRAPHRLLLGSEFGQRSCALRVLPAESSFDRSYDVDVTGLVGGRPVGAVRIVDDQTALMDVWHAELAPTLAADKSNFDEVANASAFRRWRWTLGEPSAEELPGQPFANGSLGDLFEVDGVYYTTSFDGETSRTSALTPSGEFGAGMTGPGQIVGMVRIR
jgi:hypothetical protein